MLVFCVWMNLDKRNILMINLLYGNSCRGCLNSNCVGYCISWNSPLIICYQLCLVLWSITNHWYRQMRYEDFARMYSSITEWIWTRLDLLTSTEYRNTLLCGILKSDFGIMNKVLTIAGVLWEIYIPGGMGNLNCTATKPPVKHTKKKSKRKYKFRPGRLCFDFHPNRLRTCDIF